MKIFYLVIITLLVSSCGISSKDVENVVTFPRYGNYCGLDRPSVGETPVEIDEVDLACKNHDACYDQKGSFNIGCDTSLIAELKNISPKSEKERIARKWIISYFRNSPQKDLMDINFDDIKL